MIRSMTGFGGARADVDGARYAVEIRSVNNKFFKTQLRLPDELMGLEAELESHLGERLNRGSIVVTVKFSDTSPDAAAEINSAALGVYIQQILEAPGIEHERVHVDVGALLDLPGVLVVDTGEQRVNRAKDVLKTLVDEACDAVIAMRVREGKTLYADLIKHSDRIAEHLRVVEQRAPEVVELYQDRLQQRMSALLEDTSVEAREEDILREVAVFAERSDIAEEVSRLRGHLNQFSEIIDGDGDEPVGRTLDFVSQEMLREANTIASKCLDVDISRRIVEIKSAIDRIKEQAQNVE